VYKAIDASKVPGPSFFCHFSPKNCPRAKHTKTYKKVRAFFVKTSTRGKRRNIKQNVATLSKMFKQNNFKQDV
jgi:hypothetical protein